MDGNELLVGVVEESDLVGDVHANSVSADSFATDSFPDYELVVILATERSQVLLVVGERQTLDQHLMHLESVHHLKRVEVPDDDVRLKALVGFLSTSDVLSCVGDNDDRDFVVMASEELLCSANNVSDDDGRAEREDDVLIVRV
jgi:hypothetical protein